MGDTGSLALGAALGGVGILSGNLFALLVLTLLFFLRDPVGHHSGELLQSHQGTRRQRQAVL